MSWIFILIGFIAIIVLYIKYKDQIYKSYLSSVATTENFQTSVAAPATSTGTAIGPYTISGVSYYTYIFKTVGQNSITLNSPGVLDILVIGGGGGTVGGNGGGGGAGGLVFKPLLNADAGTYNITVGAGGEANKISNSSPTGGNGQNSNFTYKDGYVLTALGGGGGGAVQNSSPPNVIKGGDGGSGGGGGTGGGGAGSSAAGKGAQKSQAGDSGIYGYGNDGGTQPYAFTNTGGGGGGGAGGKGSGDGVNSIVGVGGPGLYQVTVNNVNYNFGTIFNTNTIGVNVNGNYYFAAGGSAIGASPPIGGSGPHQEGAANTGNGGGGAEQSGAGASKGGTGIVVIRYKPSAAVTALASASAKASASASAKASASVFVAGTASASGTSASPWGTNYGNTMSSTDALLSVADNHITTVSSTTPIPTTTQNKATTVTGTKTTTTPSSGTSFNATTTTATPTNTTTVTGTVTGTTTSDAVTTIPLATSVSSDVSQTLIQLDKVLYYLTSFNIFSSDPRTTIKVQYSFNNYNENNILSFKQTGVEGIICTILSLKAGSVVAVGLTNDMYQNNNAMVTFNISYPQLAAATAALASIDDQLQLQTNRAKILAPLPHATSMTLVGAPLQGNNANANNTYFCKTNSWCDFINPGVYQFNIQGSNIPSVINSSNGLKLYGLQLTGPPSESASPDINNYLNSFTTVFYMKFNSLNFVSGNSIIWYQLFCETPNMVRFAIYYNTNTTSTVEVIIGDKDTNYRWVIPNTTLMSNGYDTLYSFVYDKENAVMLFNIGNTVHTAKIKINLEKPVILALSPISINRGIQSLDVNLYAFIHYNSILSATEISQLSQYLLYQKNGISQLQSSNNANYNTVANMTEQVSTMNQQVQDLTKQVTTCNTTSGVPTTGSNGSSVISRNNRHWQVNVNDLQTADQSLVGQLNTCSPLKLKQYNVGSSQIKSQQAIASLSPIPKVSVAPQQISPTPPPSDNNGFLSTLKTIFT